MDKKNLFSGAQLKVERANQHIQQLSVVFEEFSRSDFYKLGVEKDPNTGNYLVKLEVIAPIPPPRKCMRKSKGRSFPLRGLWRWIGKAVTPHEEWLPHRRRAVMRGSWFSLSDAAALHIVLGPTARIKARSSWNQADRLLGQA